MAYCKNCGKQLREGNKFCMACGTPVQQYTTNSNTSVDSVETTKLSQNQSENICAVCGNAINQGLKFCPSCGAQIQHNVTSTQPSQPQNCSPQTQTIGGNTNSGYNNYPPHDSYPQKQHHNTSYPVEIQSEPSSKAPIIISIAVSAVVLVAAIIIAVIFLFPNIQGGNSGNNAAGQDPFVSSETVQSTELATVPMTEPITEAPTQVETQPQTQPETQPVAPDNTQKITVVSSGSSATLTLYEWQNGQWKSLMSVYATVGANGVGYNYGEGAKMTPKGTYNIGFCYGLNKPTTNLSFKQIKSNSIFVDDSSSKYYNCLVTTNEYSGSGYENTYKQFAVNNNYSYNIFIEHNGDGETPNSAIPGKGSVITICGYNGTLKPTLGCIDISSGDMIKLLSYLDASKNPVIEIS
ncbi:MAG: zinc-ribbon domain-containing protein [Acutalibacteraceae bacterium]